MTGVDLDPDLDWQRITTRRGAAILREFTCTTDPPRTPGGRRLPHDRLWEWEAQRHLRQTSQLLQPGDLLLVGTRGTELIAAVHLKFDASDDLFEVFIAAGGVALSARGKGGGIADQMLATIRAEGIARARALGCIHLVLTGKIHRNNHASQRMVQRAGFEPYGLPSTDYQSWVVVIPLRV